MKNIIFYKSNTGFTKQYVDMLQNRIVPLEVYKVEKINKKLLEGADNVFFAGPLRNNVILGLSKFISLNPTLWLTLPSLSIFITTW